jgi:hypothetical protein
MLCLTGPQQWGQVTIDNPLKLWAQTNPSFFKSFLSGICHGHESLTNTSMNSFIFFTFQNKCQATCVSQFFVTVTNIREKNFKRKKDLFWLMFSEILMQSLLDSLLWARGGRICWQWEHVAEAAYLMEARKQIRDKGVRRQTHSSEAYTQCLTSPSPRSQLPSNNDIKFWVHH